jgi:tetratricopeptide (TPR) repeat protein
MKTCKEFIRDRHIYIWLLFLGIMVYGKSVRFEYTYADDTQLLVVNQEFLSHLSNLPKLFTTEVFLSIPNAQLFYRPFLNVLFMVVFQIFPGGSPAIFHAVGILLHLSCVCLLFYFLRYLDCSRLKSALFASIFCVHPVLTSAVVWIPGYNDTLMTLFILVSSILFLKALKTKRRIFWVGHFLFFVCALLTKESAVVLPVLCIAFLYSEKQYNQKTRIKIAGGYGILVLGWVVIRNMVQRTFEIHQTTAEIIRSWVENLPAIFLYIGKVFVPLNYSNNPNFQDNTIWIGVLVGILFLALNEIGPSESRKYVLGGTGWFLLFLLPSFAAGTIFYEHRIYCSMVGFAIACPHIPFIRKASDNNRFLLCAAFFIIAGFAAVTFHREENFRNRFAYATEAFRSSPGRDESYGALAGYYLDQGNDAAAEKILLLGMSRNSSMFMVHRMYADILSRRGEYDRAVSEYETALRLEPLHLYTYINYGKLCLKTGQIDKAGRLWQRSVLINPEFILGYYYLANFYIHTKNNPDSAMIYVREIQQHGAVVMPELLEAVKAAQRGSR